MVYSVTTHKYLYRVSVCRVRDFGQPLGIKRLRRIDRSRISDCWQQRRIAVKFCDIRSLLQTTYDTDTSQNTKR